MLSIPANLRITLVFFFLCTCAFGQNNRYVFEKGMMGSPFKLIFYAENDSVANIASQKAFARIQELNDSLSDYRDGSEINKLSAQSGTGKWVHVGQDLFNILWISKDISKKTEGAFDVTMGPVVQLWRRAVRHGKFPDDNEIRVARSKTGYEKMMLDSATKSVLLTEPGMRLDIGGLGKGFAAEEAMKIIRTFGIRSAMVDAGGKIVVTNAPPGTRGWNVTVSNGSDSLRTILLANTSVATSGPTYRYLEFKGIRYSHIVDPKTGIGLTYHIRTTAVHPDGTVSDALATAFSIVGIKRTKEYLKAFPGTKVWLVEYNDGKVTDWNSLE
jgi:thiamine biosynthesis lipoprotein